MQPQAITEPRQSICVSRSFAHEITAPQELASHNTTLWEDLPKVKVE